MICILHVEKLHDRDGNCDRILIEYLQKCDRFPQPKYQSDCLYIRPRRIRLKEDDFYWHDEAFWDIAQAAIDVTYQMGWR